MKRGDRGSVLMLVPAAVLVLVILGAIAIDSAVTFLGARELANRTAAAANDIATVAVSDDSFYGGRGVSLDADRADAYVARAFAPANRPEGFVTWDAQARLREPRTVEVEAWGEVRFVFAPALPGFKRTTRVHSISVAEARGG